jgi:hypothetical protein
MAGLVPAIHVLKLCRADHMDARHKAGHDSINHCPVLTGLSLLISSATASLI